MMRFRHPVLREFPPNLELDVQLDSPEEIRGSKRERHTLCVVSVTAVHAQLRLWCTVVNDDAREGPLHAPDPTDAPRVLS